MIPLTRRLRIVAITIVSAVAIFSAAYAALARKATPYPDMPSIASIGQRVGDYQEIPVSARGPAVDPAKGYRLQNLGAGLYMITDNVYQSMFLVYDQGVVVVDAPPNYSAQILKGIAEITRNPVTHVIYSHSHSDHIGGVRALGGNPIIIAHQETRRLLARAADPDRPLPMITFGDNYTLNAGGKLLELSYHGDAHVPGNIFIYAPEQRVLMAVDLVFPGWMPWRRFAVAHDVPGHFEQIERIRRLPWTTLVSGHVARTGTHADVDQQAQFNEDLRMAAAEALAGTKPGEGLNARDRGNPWAVYDDYIDRVVLQCVNRITAKWSRRLAAFDTFVWDQCYAMEQSLRID